ncbi:hypothetical protein MMC34_003200 [Xylographa carneopallida]|nr:hypothetical protein [Xylographa carneopallida]
MVNMLSVGAATPNVTKTNFEYEIFLTDGIFGLQELKSVLRFQANNWGTSTLFIQTSGLAILVFTLLVSTFAIDHYLFNSRYLVHIGGVNTVKSPAAALDDKAALHEKEALQVESGQGCSNDKDSPPEQHQSEHNSGHAASSKPMRWVYKATYTALVLFLCFVGEVPKGTTSGIDKATPERSDTKTEAEWKPEMTPSTSQWNKIVRHPWMKAIARTGILLVGLLGLLFFFAYHLCFWPAVLLFVILKQGCTYDYFNEHSTIPWQSIALKSTLYLIIWTTIGATLLVKPNRFQGVLWKCFKWTYAVTWWLFWLVLESNSVWTVASWLYGLHYNYAIVMQVFFFVQPIFIAHLCSGIVCDAVVAIRVLKYFRTTGLDKL